MISPVKIGHTNSKISFLYYKITRWWLICMLVFLPFQLNIYRISELLDENLSKFLNRLDEFTVVIFFPLAIIEFYRKKETIRNHIFILLLPIVAIVVSGFISGIINNNTHLVTIHGIFDYIKYFFVIFIFSAFFRDFNEFKKIFSLLLIIAVFLGAIAFIQETWALLNRYVLDKSIYHIVYFEVGQLLSSVTPNDNISYLPMPWRIGIYRAPSLMINANASGLYALLIFTVYAFIKEKGSFTIFFFLIFGILGSVSRIVYSSAVFVMGLQIIRERKWLIVLAILMGLLLFQLTFEHDFYLWKLGEQGRRSVWEKTNVDKGVTQMSFREYTRGIAIKLWRKNIIWGVGPGMFGGPVSITYNSPFYDYEKYKFMPLAKLYLTKWQTIDQFWPQVLAELGIAGIVCFTFFFISLAVVLFLAIRRTLSHEIRGALTGLMTYVVVIFIYSFAYHLNIPPILFSYFALIGITLGCVTR